MLMMRAEDVNRDYVPSAEFDRAMRLFFDLKRERWEPKTRDLNKTVLNLFRQFSENDPWPPSKELVLDWLHTVRNSTNPHGKPISPATVHTYWRHFSGFCYFCEDEGLLTPEQNPARLIKYRKMAPKKAEKLPVAFPESHLIRVLEYLAERAEGDTLTDRRCIRDYAMILFAYVTGCRVGEFLNLTLLELDLTERKSLILAETNKGKADRFVGFDEGVAEALQNWLEYRREMNPQAPNVFLSYGGRLGKGKPLQVNAVNQMMRRHLKAIGIPHGKAHKLRHNAALAAIKAGVNLRDVQAQLGHKSIRTTENYLRMAEEDHLDSFRKNAISERLNKQKKDVDQ